MRLDLISGPPGTGKTTTIAQDVAREAERVGKHHVLVASLTRAAAREAARVVDLPDKQIGTWHSFAYRALGMPELTEAHIKDWNEAYPALALTGKGKGSSGETLEWVPEGWNNGDKLSLEYSRLRAREIPRPWREGLMPFVERWEDWKRSCGYVDFHDLIEQALDVDEAPGNPAVLFGDESQDLSLAEARLIQHWSYRAERLVLAGDVFQSLFGWRGSNPAEVDDIWDNLDPSCRILEQSYRIPRAVHEVATAQMKRCAPFAPVPYRPRDAEGLVLRASPFRDGLMLVRHASQALADGKSVMFIATCAYMLEPIMKALGEAGIPWHNPWRVSNGRWNPLQVSKGVGLRERCVAFCRPCRAVWGDKAKFWSVADLKAWTRILPVRGIFRTGARTVIGNLPETTTELDVAEGMQTWFTSEALAYILRFDLDWYLKSIPRTDQKHSYRLIGSMVGLHGPEVLIKSSQVIVGTVHSLKGSEADWVYLCPDLSLAAVQSSSTDQAMREEIQRVFYVGITRAREALVLCEPGSRLHVRL